MMKTHYETIGVAQTATATEIKDAYRHRVKIYAGVYSGADKDKTHSAELVALNNAYAILKDSKKRGEYDCAFAIPANNIYTTTATPTQRQNRVYEEFCKRREEFFKFNEEMNRKACKQQFKIEAKIICSAVEMATIASNVLAVQSGYFAQNPSVNLVMSGVGLVMAGAFFIKVNNKYFKSLVEQKLDDTFKKFEQQNSSKYNKYKAAAEIFAPVLIASRVVEKIRHLKHTASPR